MTSVIHLIRHGITEGITGRYFYGWRDLPVIEEGFKELEEFKKQGIYPKLDLEDTNFYTSGMIRANQTLETIYGKVDFTENPKLKEINFGAWEMKTYKDLEDENKWQEWMEDRTGTFAFPGGGDSTLSFYARIMEGFNEVKGQHRMKELSHRHSGKDAVSCIVCHGGTIAAMMLHLFEGEREYIGDWTPHTGCGYSVYFENGEPVRYEEINPGGLRYQF